MTCTTCSRELPADEFYLRGDGSPRRQCKSCIRAADQTRYQRTREHRSAKAAERYRANPGAWSDRAKAWGSTSTGKASLRQSRGRRRATMLGADSGCWFAREDYVTLLRNDPCVYCGAPSESLEHINPISVSKDDTWSNLAAACRFCNTSKKDKDLLGFLLTRKGPPNG